MRGCEEWSTGNPIDSAVSPTISRYRGRAGQPLEGTIEVKQRRQHKRAPKWQESGGKGPTELLFEVQVDTFGCAPP